MCSQVLVVDDDLGFIELLMDLLELDGLSARAALTVDAAWASFNAHHASAVITDYTFQDGSLTGLDLAQCIKQASPTTLVIMLSGDPPPDASAICDVVFVKPIPYRELKQALELPKDADPVNTSVCKTRTQ